MTAKKTGTTKPRKPRAKKTVKQEVIEQPTQVLVEPPKVEPTPVTPVVVEPEYTSDGFEQPKEKNNWLPWVVATVIAILFGLYIQVRG